MGELKKLQALEREYSNKISVSEAKFPSVDGMPGILLDVQNSGPRPRVENQFNQEVCFLGDRH